MTFCQKYRSSYLWWTLLLASGANFLLSQYSQLWHWPWPLFTNAAIKYFLVTQTTDWLHHTLFSFYRMLLQLQRVCPLLWCAPVHASNYRLYVTRELKNAGSKDEDEVFCHMPFCLKPAGDSINWAQCDKCTKWCHYQCVGLDCEAPETFWCPMCCMD